MVAYSHYRLAVWTPQGALIEYPYTDEEPPNTTTVYVEIPPENEPQTFVIDIRTVEPLDRTKPLGCNFRLAVDGTASACGIRLPSAKNERIRIRGLYLSAPGSKVCVMKEVSFTPICRTENCSEMIEGIEERVAKFGTIELDIRDYESLERRFTGYHGGTTATPFDGKLHEKQLKGSSTTHTVKVGKNLEVYESDGCKRKKSKTKHTVRFLYRSRFALQSLGVIPYPEDIKPQLPRNERPASARVKRQRSESFAEIDENRTVQNNRSERVKRERLVKREPRGEVVDLTGVVPNLKKEKKKKVEVVDLSALD